MCVINFMKNYKGNLSKKDLDKVYSLMSLGALGNKDAHGFFNSEYTFKSDGMFKISNLVERNLLKDNFVVGHNRYSTSGKDTIDLYPTEGNWFTKFLKFIFIPEKYWGEERDNNINNHPFKLGDFTMVHNGVIWNYRELSGEHSLKSKIQTDSYVILQLIYKFFRKSKQKIREKRIISAIKSTFKLLKGSFSVFLFDNRTKKLYYFKNYETSMNFMVVEKKYLVGSTKRYFLKNTFFRKKKETIFFNDNTLYEITDNIKEPLRELSKLKLKSKKMKGGEEKNGWKFINLWRWD